MKKTFYIAILYAFVVSNDASSQINSKNKHKKESSDTVEAGTEQNEGPTKTETMDWIRSKVENVEVKYKTKGMSFNPTAGGLAYLQNGSRVDPSRRVQYMDGTTEKVTSIGLSDDCILSVSSNWSVASGDENDPTGDSAPSLNRDNTITYDLKAFDPNSISPHTKKAILGEDSETFPPVQEILNISIADIDLANRVSEALHHLVKLCGGKPGQQQISKEPF